MAIVRLKHEEAGITAEVLDPGAVAPMQEVGWVVTDVLLEEGEPDPGIEIPKQVRRAKASALATSEKASDAGADAKEQ